MRVIEIPWQSELHRQEIALRLAILRQPLGLRFSDEELRNEVHQWHFGALDQQRLVACALIVPLGDGVAKLRQMAVAVSHQRQGIGSALIRHIEGVLSDREFTRLELHARASAVDFYRRLGYSQQGAEFSEVSLPHWKMAKSIPRRSG